MQFIHRSFRNSLRPNLLRLFAITLLLGMVLGQTPMQNAQAQSGEPMLLLTKTIDDDVTNAKVGDTIFYRLRFACSSLTTDCGDVEITDALPLNPSPPNNPLFTYMPADSSVPAGFHMTESPTGTITITKDDNLLLDGSQYDAVIAVRVNYDTRPLPATVVNTASGRIKPPGATNWNTPVTSDAPPVTIDGVTVDWDLTKTLYSPSIEPTVNTNVTYRIQLCPGTTSGNVALSNIVITDTLPAGAQYVSASNSGTESGGVVTWNITGPITPPSCATRYVTVRYPTPTFKVGDPLTNSASATADYIPSGGGTCAPNCFDSGSVQINHNIIDIVEVPTYSKNDAGDPVGITGTARFILNLHTNGTNYPANSVTLIDTLPAQLQVTGVTSGAWATDHVRATIQYATNYDPIPPNWTNFPGQPVEYNDNNLYDSGLPVNITRIRWFFEYDSDPNDLDGDGNLVPLPGLPYDWTFSNSPEIRVAPRLTATTASDGTPMLAAVTTAPNNVYTNCLQVSRIDSGGNPVIGACDNETMTVEGDYVSLRTTKSETPGYAYDPVVDPQILNFMADTSLLPNDTLHYVLTVNITERSSADLVNPIIQDTLPPELIFVRNGTAQLDGVNLATQPHFSQSGQLLTWAWTDNSTPLFAIPPFSPNPLTVIPLTLGSRYLTVDFYARIPPGTSPSNYTNTLYVVTDSVDVHCEVGTTEQDSSNGDLDNDSDITDPACRNTDNFRVERSAALRGEKWIRSVAPQNNQMVRYDTLAPDPTCPSGGIAGLPGGGSNPFTRYPCISQAYPEGALSNGQYTIPPPIDPTLDDFEYNLRIFNEGNVEMLEYILYDILPYYGDKGSGGALVGSARNSEFRPVMRGPVEFISGLGLTGANFTIEYSQSTNPCRPEVFDKDPVAYPNTPAGCADDWVPAASIADWTTIHAYRIELTSGSILPAVTAGSEPRFGLPMSIPKDSPIVGAFNNDDPQSREIAWNSYSHVGSYDKDEGAPVIIQDLLASEPRKVGVTIPERFSIGNRVWRDSDNSGTINAPDDTDPGIGGVTVNLYADTDGNGVPDGPAIATTITDTAYIDGLGVSHEAGYYLFSNLLAGKYVVGIPASNFAAGQPLYTLRSSTGTPADTKYTSAPLDANADREDHGRDPAAPGNEVFSPSIDLSTVELTSESDLSDDDADGIAGARRGINGERNNDSDLTVDFGFFGGTDVPFSIGNHLWYDNGAGGGVVNNGIRDGSEPPVAGARVELYRDGNKDGLISPSEFTRFDITDSTGFYLFDNLDPGEYFVLVHYGNFTDSFDPDGAGPLPTAPGVLQGWYSSQPTTLAESGVDGDDNGINNDVPEVQGVISSVIILERGVDEPLGESHLSGQADPGAPANAGFNPTGWDGPLPGSRGRFGETDATSNLTIDFGFIPPMSLGNRVWIDEGAGEATFRAGYNNGLRDGTETGVSGVRVELWRDANGNGTLDTGEFIRYTTTDTDGYYLFDRIQPGTNYYIHIPDDNFGDVGVGDLVAGNPLANYISSFDGVQTTAPADDTEDKDDNGIDNGNNPAANGVTSPLIMMAYNTEPLTPANETDINNSGTYGPQNVGNFWQEDNDSNLTMDFGFVRPPRSIGNYLWFDTGGGAGGVVNDGIRNGTEGPVPAGTRVSLYLDANIDGRPDDLGVVGNRTDDWVAYDETDANGYYLFDNLPPGNYIVGVDRINFATGNLVGYTSSTSNVDNAANDLDSRDNGVDRPALTDAALSPHGILSTRINLTANPLTLPAGETGSGNTTTTLGNDPTAGDGPNSRGRYGETDTNSDLTIDFGLVNAYSIGNRVWFDTNNNGLMDIDPVTPANSEVGVDGVQVQLYLANVTLPTGAVIDTQVTANGGYYLFDHLPPNNYVVVITADNFNSTGTYNALVGYWSSLTIRNNTNGAIIETAAPDPDTNGPDGTPRTADDDVDLDDNGLRRTAAGAFQNAVLALPVTVGPTGNTEPTNDDDLNTTLPGSQQGQLDARANMKVDFGFYRTEIGNLVFEDVNLNGAYNTGEILLDGVRVRLYQRNNSTEVNVGPDGILGTTDDTTNGVLTGPNASHPLWAAGEYRFSGLPEGDYIVRVTAGVPAGMISTIDTNPQIDNDDPDINIDNNDNGDGEGPVIVGPPAVIVTSDITNFLTTNPGSTGAQNNNTFTQSNGTTTDNTVDFGFVNSYSLGNRVWFDTNNNGILDAVESGITGVRVELYYDTNGDGVYNPGLDQHPTTNWFATTDANGYYRFDNLFPRDYIVVIPADNFRNVGALDIVPGDPLRSYWSTGISLNNATGIPSESSTNDPDTNADAYNNVASDENGATTFTGSSINYVSAAAVTLGANAEPLLETAPNGQGTVDQRANMTVDFGFYRTEIGNLVFRDNDISGHYNAGDTPIDNIVVRLYDNANHEVPVGPDGILSTTDDATGGVVTGPLAVIHPTWAAGEYHFSGLPAGNYVVRVTLPTGTVSTIDTNPQADNDNPNTNIDNNDNGDGGTDGTVTFDTGDYLIMNPGTDALKPNRTVTNNNGTTIDPTIDFGFVELVAIGNRVWFDTGAGVAVNANNGILDAGEVGVNNVTVQLYGLGIDGIAGTADDTLAGTATTASIGANAGYYQFDNLFPSQYYVKIPASEFNSGGDLIGYVSSVGYGGLNDDDDQSGATGDENGIDGVTRNSLITNGIATPIFTLTPNSEPTADEHAGIYTGSLDNDNVNFTADFGFAQLVTIGNYVWLDNGVAPDDGIQQADEPGVNNVEVQLYREGQTPGTDTPVRTTNTDTNGNYVFDNLVPGRYFVHIPTSEFALGQPLYGYVSSTDDVLTPKDETSDQNTDENGLDSVSPATPATSGISTNIFDLTIGGETTADDESTYTGYLDDANVNFTADFGFLQKVALGNRVWLDNGAGGGPPNNGILDGSEPGINGVRVVLYNAVTSAYIKDTTTIPSGGQDGYYVFDNLLPGSYYIWIPPTEFGVGQPLENLLSSTNNGADETTNEIPVSGVGDENGVDDLATTTNGIRSTVFVLAPDSEPSGEPQTNYTGALDDDNVNFTADFGFIELVAIGNRVWKDTGAAAGHYNNGILDADEFGVDGVVVELYDAATNTKVVTGPDGIPNSGDEALGDVITSGGGYYKFDKLLPGTYYVRIPATEFDASIDPLFGFVSTIDIAAKNETSDQTADENGLDQVSKADLAANGIRANNFTLLPNAMPAGEDQSNYGGTLDDNNVNFTADFGFVQLVAIGNRVWYDVGGAGGGTPNDGIQFGTDEIGANGVTMELYREGQTPGTDTPIRTTATNVSGNYAFDNLVPGRYSVHIPASMFDATAPSPLQGFLSSTGAGNNETSDQDADENGIEVANLAANGISTQVYTLAANGETTTDDETSYIGYLDNDDINFTADFGFLNIVAIGNRVWFDNGTGGGISNDGIQNGSEPGVDGVRVELYLSTQTPGMDTPVRTTTTNPTGYYVFDNLLAGTYVVHIPASNFGLGQPLYEYFSSYDNPADVKNEDEDQSMDENGIDQPNPITTGITSMTYVLSANSEPTGTDNDTGYLGVLDDDDVNFTADFGFVQKYALGNRVWLDTNDNAMMDIDPANPTNPTYSEIGVNGVLVELYRVGQTPGTDTPVATDLTANGGYYLFDKIYSGEYIVAIAADNFIENGANDRLVGYWSSLTSMGADGTTAETAAPDPDDDVDQDDNGTHQASSYVVSLPVTIGPSGNTEPTDEIDVDTLETGADHQGSQPNGRANMKVDFGFYKVSMGDLVFSDGVKDGTYVSADDVILPGVLVHLLSSNGTEIITGADGKFGTADDALGPDGAVGGGDDGTGGVFTNASGQYRFDGLPRGDYIIRVDSPVGTSSTIDNGSAAMQSDNDNPNDNLNNNDNGDGIIGGPVSSAPVTLTPGVVATNNTVTNSDGSTHNPTLDFGFIPAFSLGNRVWYDTNNLGTIDNSEVGINGVLVEVYAADASGNPTGPVLDTDTTHSDGGLNNGYYLFSPLPAGNYVVVVTASNFTSGVLQGYWSSGLSRNNDGSLVEINSPNPNNDLDSDDNGMHTAFTGFNGAVISKPVTLGPNPTEPTNDNDLDVSLPDPDSQGQPDNRGNMSVDFGFYTIQLGDLVWEDTDNSGTVNGVEVGFNTVDVQLWTADGLTMLGSDTTDASGNFTFAGLPQGNFLVRIPNTEFEGTGTLVNYVSSTGVNSIVPPVPMGPNEPAPDADVNTTDSDDNGTETGGTLGLGGYIQSEIITLNPALEDTYNNANGSTSEPRVDFGVFRQDNHLPVIGIAKNLVSVTEVSPGTYNVIYDILVENMGDVPLNGVQVTDNLSATFTAPTTATVQSISAIGLTVNLAYNGNGNLLAGTDTVAVGASGTIRLAINVIPYAAGPFNNTAIASGTNPFGGATVTDRSQNGTIPDSDGDGDPTNNNVPTPVDFGPSLFDPPIGIKVFNDSGLPLLQWTMTWINSTNIAAINARVSDPIPAGTTYVASGASSGYPVPGGAPAGSTNVGVSCLSPSAATTTTLCYYEGPTAGSPLGRIIWEGVLGPDFGHTTAATAVNELVIAFRVNVPSGVTAVYNIATIDADRNGDRVFAAGVAGAPGDLDVADGQAIWVRHQEATGEDDENFRPSLLPFTGFAPNKVTVLPEQPADKAYLDIGGVWLEIPRLGINTSIAGIPQAEDGTWDVSWLWNQAGWLQGTAYPTLNGNSAITGHVYLPNGEPGPFVDVHKLAYGDKIIIHAYGQKYIYEVRENEQVKPGDTSVLKYQDNTWVTLITCLGYNESTNTYASRVAVKAVLMTVEEEKPTNTPTTNSSR